MIAINNVNFDNIPLVGLDLFIGVISYESRSIHIFEKLPNDLLLNNKVLMFCTDNYVSSDIASSLVNAVKEKTDAIKIVDYKDYTSVINQIMDSLNKLLSEKEEIMIGIDYSSMPRSWYCRLPVLFEKKLRAQDKVYFWYSEGSYGDEEKEYPTAGLDIFELFSGKATLLPEKRAHIFALSYDAIRTQGIISKLEPEYFVVCEAYDPVSKDIHERIAQVNEAIICQSALYMTLDISDFAFMITKLKELTKELRATSDVVLVPDGPKPLILAMSMIPSLITGHGVSCLFANRDYENFTPINVSATGKIVGFEMKCMVDLNQ